MAEELVLRIEILLKVLPKEALVVVREDGHIVVEEEVGEEVEGVVVEAGEDEEGEEQGRRRDAHGERPIREGGRVRGAWRRRRRK